jgi:hypothetical protein
MDLSSKHGIPSYNYLVDAKAQSTHGDKKRSVHMFAKIMRLSSVRWVIFLCRLVVLPIIILIHVGMAAVLETKKPLPNYIIKQRFSFWS